MRTVVKLSILFNLPQVKEWMGRLLGGQEENVDTAYFGVRRFDPGDVYSSHNDDIDGRRGGLSFTSYLTSDAESWKASWGGHFVWCADPANPVFVKPEANTMVLFRVEQSSWHHVQPLLEGAPARYVFQGWWRLNKQASQRFPLFHNHQDRKLVTIKHNSTSTCEVM